MKQHRENPFQFCAVIEDSAFCKRRDNNRHDRLNDA